MRFRLWPLIAVLAALGAYSSTAAAASDREWFMATPCEFDTDKGRDVQCGIYYVPEDRSQQKTVFLGLPVAIFTATEPTNGNDPILYLDGGPGTLEDRSDPEWIDYWRDWLDYETWTYDRDFIVPTQRGAAYDRMTLSCPQLQNPAIFAGISELPGLNTDWRENTRVAMRACKDRYNFRGHDLSAYTTAQIADDMASLISVLGYERTSLFAVSYGTRLGLTLMRRHPETIASAVLDSLSPPETLPDIDYYAQLDRSLSVLFDTCEQSFDCLSSFPDLKAAFDAVYMRLQVEPIEVRVSQNGSGGDGYWRVDGDAFLDVVFSTLYWKSLIADLPRIIYRASAGDYDDLETLVVDYIGDQTEIFADGMFLAVECREVYPGQLARAEEAAAMSAADQASAMRSWATNGWLAHTCPVLGVPFAPPDYYDPVVSDIPTLLLAGLYDPVTPPAFAERAASSLSTAYLYKFGNASHSVLEFDACATDIIDEFMDNPGQQPEAFCFDESATIQFELH